MYEERYKRQVKSRMKDYSLKLPEEKVEQELKKIEGDDRPIKECEHNARNARGIVEFDDVESDMPIQLKEDPYSKQMHQCVFCKYNIPLDYKNTQLLSQFVSQHTGLIYSQEVTGLCSYKYTELEKTVESARRLGLMPFFYKETVFLNDPALFDPYKNSLKLIPNNHDKRKLNADPAVEDANLKKQN